LFDTFRKKEDERKIIANIRDTLLPKLISGQIRIKDAEKFVERIENAHFDQ
jgi:type I restriction enzyme S subunit